MRSLHGGRRSLNSCRGHLKGPQVDGHTDLILHGHLRLADFMHSNAAEVTFAAA